ncbi:AMP-binding protein [uncultured Mailhella sp.]|uniref:AMP-binding protein n=1 Tax=uncultured Mailhella sp. TaxID=1981031 RepID=UPI0025D55785|nr:AMP-binding protein [uncultured Mailhella sp.]
MLGFIVRHLLRLIYRVELRGREHYDAAGPRTLILYNPGSIIDPLLLAAMLPDRITLLADRALEHKWWMRPVCALTDTQFFDFASPAATVSLVHALARNGRCMVFHSGSLGNDPRYTRILEAAGVIAEKASASLLPVRIDGAISSMFSYSRHKGRRRWFPRITVSVLEVQKFSPVEGLPPRERRRRMGERLYDIMTELEYRSGMDRRNIMQVLMDAVALSGRRFPIAEDQDRHVLTYGALLLKLSVLGRAFRRLFRGEKRVGFLLPTSLPGLVAFFGLHSAGFVPAMLNFTSGISAVLSCCSTVQLSFVLTSRRFLAMADLTAMEQALKDAGLRLVYLEDVAKNLTLSDKLFGALGAWMRSAPSTPGTDPAAVMFTSGTEGVPKAVFLSHVNITSNRYQALSMLTVGAGDKLFNCLPMFHAFGLGICTLLPVLAGVRVFLYPSPLHYRIVPRLFYESQSTIICGTDTFCAGYARYGRPYDFCHARLVIIGAEKMRESTRSVWLEKFGVDLFEGYGATETSPLIAVNTPAYRRAGSVGRMVPGLACRLHPVPGIDEENTGVLWVKGDNVMLGYMRSAAPGVLEPPVDEDLAAAFAEGATSDDGAGWYDTGDIVHVDDEGFIFIRGRAKRFAKIGGEMVSLAAVEEALREIWPEAVLGVVSIPDPRKGEQLALVIDTEDVTTSRIAAHFASRGLSPLWTPKRIVSVKQAPLLGSGKFDYRKAKELVLEKG